MIIDFVRWQEVYIGPRGHNDECNQEESLPIEAGEEGVAAEGQIIHDGPCADKPH
jgi:hypothetical protein